MTRPDRQQPGRSASWLARAAGAVRRRLSAGDHPDGGFSVIEVLAVVPLFLALLLLVVAAGRVQDAGVRVTGAARDGARSASLQRTAGEAAAAAQQAVNDNLAGQSLGCVGGPAASVDTGAFAPGGQVTVTVSCTASLSNVAVPGLPGSATLTKTASSPVEQYRSDP